MYSRKRSVKAHENVLEMLIFYCDCNNVVFKSIMYLIIKGKRLNT